MDVPAGRRRSRAIAAVIALAALCLPSLPAQAATADDIITATTSASPEIGIVKTSTSTLVSLTLKANVATTALTLKLAQPGTSTTYTGGGFTFFSNPCTNKTLAVGGTCVASVRFNSSTKGSFTADAYYSFTSNSVNYSGAVRFSATAGTIPGTATALTTSVVSRSSLAIGWSAPIDTGGIPLTGYRLTITDTGTGAVTDVQLPSTTTSYTATGLTLGTAYSIRVSTSNALGDALLTLAGSVTFALPAPPKVANLAVSSRSTSITATWQAPSGYVDGYKIQIFNRAVPIDGTIDVATVGIDTTSYTITDLLPATPYTVKVVSFNTSTSTTATADITTQRARPEAPKNVRATSATATSITLAWQAPIEDIDGYVIEYSTDGVTWNDAGAPDDPLVTTYEVPDLEPSTSYQFRIAAYNSTDDPDGDYSSPITANTQSGLTNPPRNLTARGVDETSVLLTWQAPAPSYVDTVSYRIESRQVLGQGPTATATEWLAVDEVEPANVSYLVTDLMPCVEPAAPVANWTGCPRTEYRVISVSDWGDSDPSTTAAAEPDFRLATAPSRVAAVATQPYEITATWRQSQAGSSPIAGYTVFFSSDPRDLACVANDNGGCDLNGDSIDVDAGASSAVITDLEPGVYYVAVVTRLASPAFGDIFGLASNTANVAARGEIEPVGAVTVENISAHSASIDWDPVDTVWDAPTYVVQISTDAGETWTDALVTSSTRATLLNLRSGQSYSVQVIARDQFTTTDPSDAADFVLPLAAARSLRATSENDSSIDISWVIPDPAALITGWRIEQQVTPAGADPAVDGWEEVDTVDGSATSYRLQDVQPCDDTPAAAMKCPRLHLRVVAVNDDIESPPSPDVVGSPLFALPSAPAQVTATRTDTESFKVSWFSPQPGTAPISGYTVFYSSNADDLRTCELGELGGCSFPSDSADVDSDATSALIEGVDSGVQYYAVVVARMTSPTWGDLYGQPSASSMVRVPMPLDPPQNFTITEVGFRSAVASWDAVASDDDVVTYTVQVSDDDGLTWRDAAVTDETSAPLRLLSQGTAYQAQVIAHHSFATSDSSDPAEFHTKSYAAPSKPEVADFYVDGGGWLSIDPGADTGATGVFYSAQVVANQPGGRAIAVECDQESLECEAPDALPGTAYRVQVKVTADGGWRLSPVFVFTPPPVELSIVTDDVATIDSSVDIEAFNLRPGTAILNYGRQRMTVEVDVDGYASANVTFPSIGRKVVTIAQGSRKAAGEVWIVGVKAPTKGRYGKTVFVKVIGAAPGARVDVTTSTGASSSKISTGAAMTFPVIVNDVDGVDWSISVDGVDVAGDFIAALSPPKQ